MSQRRMSVGTPEAKSAIGRRRSAAKVESTAVYQKRRKEIAEAAVRVFNKRGFTGASISAVAEELDIDRASLYYYISSKEELFDELIREVVERNVELARTIRDSGTPAPRKLREMIVKLMASYIDSYPLIYIYIRENLSHVSDRRSAWSKHMRKLNHEMEDALISIIEQGYADKSLRQAGNPRVVAYGILGVIGWTHRWFKPANSLVSAEELCRTYADMILAGLEAR